MAYTHAMNTTTRKTLAILFWLAIFGSSSSSDPLVGGKRPALHEERQGDENDPCSYPYATPSTCMQQVRKREGRFHEAFSSREARAKHNQEQYFLEHPPNHGEKAPVAVTEEGAVSAGS